MGRETIKDGKMNVVGYVDKTSTVHESVTVTTTIKGHTTLNPIPQWIKVVRLWVKAIKHSDSSSNTPSIIKFIEGFSFIGGRVPQ
jgi:hypothetical protein